MFSLWPKIIADDVSEWNKTQLTTDTGDSLMLRNNTNGIYLRRYGGIGGKLKWSTIFRCSSLLSDPICRRVIIANLPSDEHGRDPDVCAQRPAIRSDQLFANIADPKSCLNLCPRLTAFVNCLFPLPCVRLNYSRRSEFTLAQVCLYSFHIVSFCFQCFDVTVYTVNKVVQINTPICY